MNKNKKMVDMKKIVVALLTTLMVFAGLRSFDVDAAVVERYSAFVSDMMDMPQERLFQLYKGSAFPFLFSE